MRLDPQVRQVSKDAWGIVVTTVLQVLLETADLPESEELQACPDLPLILEQPGLWGQPGILDPLDYPDQL